MNLLIQVYRKLRYNNRNYLISCVKRYSHVSGKQILEIGSGECTFESFFLGNTFVKSEFQPQNGFRQIDVTSFDDIDTWDIIIFANVLEHVFEIQKSINNIYCALRKGGMVLIHVPFDYPIHMEPHDYWRITEFGLRKLLVQFSSVIVHSHGPKRKPFSYFVVAVK